MGEKPRVFLGVPTRGRWHAGAAVGCLLRATRGGCEFLPATAETSLLCFGFNFLWARALNHYEAGEVTHCGMVHDDVEPRTAGWLDVMLAEMGRVGAAVLSAVVPIRGGGGETSTAVETGDPWNPRRLTLAECHALPPTFSAADVPGHTGGLLANTGLMLVDLSRPEWRAEEGGRLGVRFHTEDRVGRDAAGRWVPGVLPEDWLFSRSCRARGLPVYATTAVKVLHHGSAADPNWPAGETA